MWGSQFVEGPPNIPLDSRDCIVVQKRGLTDMVILYITLLMDKVIPAGFLRPVSVVGAFIESLVKTVYESSSESGRMLRPRGYWLLIRSKKSRMFLLPLLSLINWFWLQN